jgi:hypothetical protein
MKTWERRGTMVYGEDRGPGTAPYLGTFKRAEDAQLASVAPDLLNAARLAVSELDLCRRTFKAQGQTPAALSAVIGTINEAIEKAGRGTDEKSY